MTVDVLKSHIIWAKSDMQQQFRRRFSTVVVRLLRKLKVLSSILRAGTRLLQFWKYTKYRRPP